MIIFCYHDISRNPETEWAITPEQFKGHLDLLSEKGFRFVTMDDLLERTFESSPRTVAITFDDGRLGAFEFGLPILDECNCSASYYICPAFTDGTNIPEAEAYSEFMSWQQLAELIQHGHSIGSHGLTHQSLLGLPSDQVAIELRHSKITLENQLGAAIRHFAAPYGHINSAIASECAATGYQTAATTIEGVNKPPFNAYFLKRVTVHQRHSVRRLASIVRKAVTERETFRVAHVERRFGDSVSLRFIKRLLQQDAVVCDDADWTSPGMVGAPRRV